MKKLYTTAFLALASAGSLLAETPSSGTGTAMDTEAAESMLEAAQAGLEGLLSAATPVITALVLAGLAIWGALALVRIVKRAFRTGS